MSVPKYVLKTNEAVLMPVEKNNFKKYLKYFVWVIVGIVLMTSIIFKDNIFFDLSWHSRIVLIGLAIGFGFYKGKKEYRPSPMELHFYDDYFVFYLPKRYYSKRVSRKQINSMRYAEVTKCVLKAKSQRIQIYGNGTSVWYNYKKDGSLPDSPTESRHFTDGMIYFNISLADDVDFIKEIETHSPMRVIIEND